jgi:hypothetical protein
MTMLTADPTEPYWFLYEGTIDGGYVPAKERWGNNRDGLRTDHPDLNDKEGQLDYFDYVYFGRADGKRTFYLTTNQDGDRLPETVSWAGDQWKNATDGMVCFGFGRGKNSSAHYTKPASFYIGFMPENIQTKGLNKRIGAKINTIRR